MREHRSPWLEMLMSNRVVQPLIGNERADVAIVGGGIAGVTSAYEILKRSNLTVALIEADRIAHGASGHGSGQVTTAFEGGFLDMSDRFGPELARNAFRQVFSARRRFGKLAAEAGSIDDVRQVNAYIGFSSIEMAESMAKAFGGGRSSYQPAVKVYAAVGSGWNCLLKESGVHTIRTLPDKIMEMLGTKDEDYRAAAVARTSIANIASICDGLIERMLSLYPERLRLHEMTTALSVRSRRPILIECEKGRVECKRAIVCTNGYGVPDLSRTPNSFPDDYLKCVTGYMNGYDPPEKGEQVGLFFHELQPTEEEPYIFTTTWRKESEKEVLMIGGPQFACDDGPRGRKDDEKAHARIDQLAAEIFGIEAKAKVCWDGRMGYTRTGVRLAGPDPKNPDLFYNLGCNGIGILHSVYGASLIAGEIMGRKMADSLFDPRHQFSV